METPVRILIVEDSASLRGIYRHVLTQAGFSILEAETGAAALELVNRESPDILLLDRVLPDMDGSDICARVKSHPQTAETYVIMVSGLKTTEDDRVSGLEAGADDYVVKPVGKRELLARIQVAVRLHTANRRLRAANLRLQASEMQFRTLAENSPDYIARIERDGQIRYLNPAAQNLFGQQGGSRADRLDFARHLTGNGELAAQVEAVFASGQSCRMKSLIRRRNEVHHLDTRLVPEFDTAGEVTSILAVTRDFTDFVLAEQEARRLAAVIHQSVDAVQIADAQGNIIYVNAAYESLTGLAGEQVMGQQMPGLDCSCPEHTDCRFLTHLEDGAERWQGLITVQQEGRNPRELETTLFAIRDGDGKTTNYAALQRDVTERRQTEQEREVVIRMAAALRAAVSRREVLDATLDQIMLLNHVDGVAYTAINYEGQSPVQTQLPTFASASRDLDRDEAGTPSYAGLGSSALPDWGDGAHAPDLLSASAEELPMVRQVVLECIRPGEYSRLGTVFALPDTLIRRVLSARAIVEESGDLARELEFSRAWSEGNCRLSAVALVVRNRVDGILWIGTQTLVGPRMVNLLGSLVDMLVSSLERAELYEATWRYADDLEQRVIERTQELAAANEQLRELDRLKSKFVSNVSHELRTPISSLKLYLNLLERGNEIKRAQYLNMLRQSADRLGHLVQDILSLSRLEMAQIQPQEFSATDLNGVVSQVVQHLQPQAEAAGLELEFSPARELPLLLGDFNQLSQLVTALLSNALTYTQQGRVCVKTVFCAQRSEPANSAPCAHLVVEDTGMGIHPDDIPHVFDRFYRGSYLPDQDIPGTGLGLAIVKEIVNLHQGQIRLDSEVGVGTRVDVELPLLDLEGQG